MSSVTNPSQSGQPEPLIYRHEKPLFIIALVISLVAWLAILVGTLGVLLIWIGIAFLIYLFIQSAFISFLRGTASQITVEQFPDLHKRITDCCARLGVSPVPDAYLLNGYGAFNAFATRFLGRNFIVLLSDVVDALDAEPDAINFYIGHELGHIGRSHLFWGHCYFRHRFFLFWEQAIRELASTPAISTAQHAARLSPEPSMELPRWLLEVGAGRA